MDEYTYYKVSYRRKSGDRRIMRFGTHQMINTVTEKEHRIYLLQEYNRTNKRIIKIEKITPEEYNKVFDKHG